MKMKSIKKFVNRFITDERGLAAVEYAVVAGLIAVALIAAFTNLGIAVKDRIEALEGLL
jgi:pilus assembly protein Flp/PilA